jgi:hypothetical protein
MSSATSPASGPVRSSVPPFTGIRSTGGDSMPNSSSNRSTSAGSNVAAEYNAIVSPCPLKPSSYNGVMPYAVAAWSGVSPSGGMSGRTLAGADSAGDAAENDGSAAVSSPAIAVTNGRSCAGGATGRSGAR